MVLRAHHSGTLRAAASSGEQPRRVGKRAGEVAQQQWLALGVSRGARNLEPLRRQPAHLLFKALRS
eukprot:489367-Prymnesium_polylepis.1